MKKIYMLSIKENNMSSQCFTFMVKYGWLAIFIVYSGSVFVPWVPRSWQPPCNNSWVLVLHDAFIRRLGFGTDVVFTFGPYGFLYYGAIPQTYLVTLLGWLLISVGYVIAVWKAFDTSHFPNWAKMLFALLVTVVSASLDVVDAQVFVFVAFASVAWIFSKPKSIVCNVLVGTALALTSLVKFSWFIAIAPCVVTLTVLGVMR
ncbi:MAG: hypothetical protein H8M99_12520, partial [Gloeobacteraceae cyanobacterium ES-bin-144]|nr:hypothetical protein [Verrucomicrobiales bacterium]